MLFTLLFLTGNTMMQSVRERIPELAVLKTYGFSNAAIMSLVFGEALLLCVAAAGIGVAIAAALLADDLPPDRRGRDVFPAAASSAPGSRSPRSSRS